VSTTVQQTSDGDLALTNGRLTLVSGADAAAVTLFNKLRQFLGEWFLDTRTGVPYVQVLFVKNPDMAQLRAMFRRIILDTQPIVDVESLTLGPARADRSCPFAFKVRCSDGATIAGSDLDKAFIVER
jgi:hypothetical protein